MKKPDDIMSSGFFLLSAFCFLLSAFCLQLARRCKLQMILYQAINGRTDDIAYHHAILGNYFFQYVPEIVPYRTNAVKRVFLIIGIMRYQIAEKVLERGAHQIARVFDIDR